MAVAALSAGFAMWDALVGVGLVVLAVAALVVLSWFLVRRLFKDGLGVNTT